MCRCRGDESSTVIVVVLTGNSMSIGTDGNGITFCDLDSGKLEHEIETESETSDGKLVVIQEALALALVRETVADAFLDERVKRGC
jgi:hypothetical protein